MTQKPHLKPFIQPHLLPQVLLSSFLLTPYKNARNRLPPQYIIMQQQQQAQSPFLAALLSRFDQDESEATRELIEKACTADPHRYDYLRAFNFLLNTRNSHSRQRRDLAAISRLIADSHLCSALLPTIQEEVTQGESILPLSTTMELTKLIGNVCNENPHLVDNLLLSSPEVLPLLCGLYSKAETTPIDAESLTAVISFLHNIALKQTSLREERVAPCLQALLLNVLTDSRFCLFIAQKRFQSFVSSLFKFHANVPLVALGVYTALIKSARSLNEQYKALAQAFKGMANRISSAPERLSILQRAGLADKKLMAIMKLFQKAKSNIFSKFNAFSFNALLKIFVKIAIMRPVALLNQPIQNKLLVNIICDLMTSIQEYKENLEANNFLPEQAPPLQTQAPTLPPIQAELQADEAQADPQVLPPVEEQRLNFTPSQIQRFKAEFRYFQAICQVTRHFSDTYFKIIKSTIETLAVSFEKVQGSGLSPSSPQIEEAVQSRNFLIGILTVRLERILSTMLKLFPQEELSRGGYYRQIVSLLLKLIPAYYERAVQAQSKAILQELPKMQDISTQSESSVMRYTMQVIDEQSVKSFIQGKLLEKINIFSTIYEAILKFVYHLADNQEALRENMQGFVHVFIGELRKKHIGPITASPTLNLKQIQTLRLALRVATELFPNIVSSSQQEELKAKTKLYRYCRLLQKQGAQNSIFQLLSEILNNLQKHRIEDTSQLSDTPSNRQEVAKTIFAKIIVQRTKGYINFLTLAHMARGEPDLPYDEHPDSQIKYLKDHFQGYFAYLTVFNDFIKRTCSGRRFVMFKEEVLGTTIARTLDYQLHVRQGGSQEAQRVEDALLREMKERVDTASEEMLTWMIQNAHKRIHRLPLLTRKVLHFEKINLSSRMEDAAACIHQQQFSHLENFIKKISIILNRASLLLTGVKLDVKMKLPKVKLAGDEEIDIQGEVQRVANAITMLGETIKLLREEQYVDDGRLLISPNYLYSLLKLTTSLLTTFKPQQDFPQQADQLVHSSLWLLGNYIHYDSNLKQRRAIRQQDKKMAKRIVKKQEMKRMKRKHKRMQTEQEDIEQVNGNNEGQGSHELDEDGEEIPLATPPKRKARRKNRHKKRRPRSEQPPKPLKKSNSKPNLLQISQARTQTRKNRNPSKGQQSPSSLQKAIQGYLKDLLQLLGSFTTPFIRNGTLGYLLSFLSRHMKRSIVQAPPFRNFQVFIGQLTSPLLKILVRQARIPGYHLSLCKLGLQLFDDSHIKVDYELAIKRYLFEQEGDLPLAQFIKLLKDNFKEVTQSTANFVQIAVQGDSKKYPFVEEHYERLLADKAKKCTVVLRDGVELHLLNTRSETTRRKPSQENANKHIKVSDYCPEGQLFVFIEQLITHTIRILLSELDRCIQKDSQNSPASSPYKTAMQPFTIRAVMQTLQYLVRESPSLGPFIAKFKCKRILIAQMGSQSLRNSEAVATFVIRNVTVGNSSHISPQSMQEIGFLSVLIRLFSPLVVNAISGLIFQLCLDSTPLVQIQTQSQTTTAQAAKKTTGSHVPFGSVIRLKVVQEVAGIMFDSTQLEWAFRKLCLLNLVTVLMNIREMSRLFLQNGFIVKLYTQYQAMRAALDTAWANSNSPSWINEQSFLRLSLSASKPLPGSYITRLLTPFYLAPLSILQELNISFHYNKKLNKNTTKVIISTVLNRESINAQLIPGDALKKYKFKLDWPFHPRREGHQHLLEQPQPDEDEYYANEDNSEDSDALSEEEDSEDSEENSSMQLDHLQAQMSEDLQSYMSMELDQPHGGLLNDEWDYSSDPQGDFPYPDGDDHVLEIGEDLMDLQGQQLQDDEGQEDDEDQEGLQQDHQSQGNQDHEENLQDDHSQNSAQQAVERELDQYLQAQQLGDSHMNSSSLINELNALPSHSNRSHQSQPMREFTLNPVSQEDYYSSVNALLNFDKVQSIPRITKVEKRQVLLLRFFLQLVVLPQRKEYNLSHPRLKTVHQQKQQTQVEQGMILWVALSKDEHIRPAQFVQYEQIYRYDHFHKESPKLTQLIQRHFADQMQVAQRVPARRNAIIARRDNMIQIMPGWNISEVRPDPHESAGEIDEEGLQLGALGEGESHMEIDSEQEDMEGSSISQGVQLRGAEVTQAQHLANIAQILRAANLVMTARQFMRLDRETQQDILINIAEQQEINQHIPPEDDVPPQNTPRDSPLSFPQQPQENSVQYDIPRLEMLQEDALAQARVIQPLQDRNPPEGEPEGPQPQLQEMGEGQGQAPIGAPVDEVYRKMSLQHSKKVSKDVMQALNKQGKNNSKFHQLSFSQLEQLLDLLYLTTDQEHSKYPYPLIESLCLNTVSLGRISASLLTLLHLTPSKIDPYKVVQEGGHRIIKLPPCQSKQEQEIDYSVRAYPSLAMKALHLLQHLTKNYSISMALLRPNNDLPQSLLPLAPPEQASLSSFQMLISLLRDPAISRSPSILAFLIGVLDNITMHHFYKNVHEIVQRTAEQEQRVRISEDSIFLLGELLQSDDVKENLPLVSKIIMRLSVEEHNLRNFIGFLEQLVQKLTGQALEELEKEKQAEGDKEKGEANLNGTPQQPPLKIVNIMAIFYQMVKAFETFPTTIDKHEEVMLALRRIVQFQRLQQLCEKAVRGVFQSPYSPHAQTHPHPRAGQLIDCFFVLFEIASITNPTHRNKTEKQDQHNHIAQLGQLQMGKLGGMCIQHQELVLGKFNLSALWRQAVSQPSFKQYVNLNIRKKMSQPGRRGSPLDLPIIKIAAATPHLLSFDNKYALFKVELKRLRGKAKYQPIHISLRREDVFQSSFEKLMTRSGQKLRGKLKIQFQQEQGQDAGGITREWFQLLSREMFNANYGLFRSGSAGHTYHPSPSSYFNERHLDYFKFIGRIAGKALYDGYLLDAYFTPAFYKHILAIPITFRDMEQEDYEYFKSLSWILENSPIEDFLELTFTYDCDNFGQVQTKELVPHGAEMPVTEENKLQYVQLIAYAKMATSIKHQLQAFLTGLHQLVPHRLLKIFSEKELEIMISGRPTIDIEDLRRNTELVNYMRNDPIIVWLFEVLQSFDMELRTAFIQFVTGSSRVPVEGFKDLRGMNGVQRFNIHREFQEERLPRAHTCFNQLDLPNYKSKEILVEKLSYAITEGREGFGMI